MVNLHHDYQWIGFSNQMYRLAKWIKQNKTKLQIHYERFIPMLRTHRPNVKGMKTIFCANRNQRRIATANTKSRQRSKNYCRQQSSVCNMTMGSLYQKSLTAVTAHIQTSTLKQEGNNNNMFQGISILLFQQ